MGAGLPQWLSEFARSALRCADQCRNDRRLCRALPREAYERTVGRYEHGEIAALRMHALSQWAYGGMPVIELAAPLAAAFCLTEYDAVEPGDCRWPFPTFLVAIRGESPLEVVVDDASGRKLASKLIWLHSWEDADARPAEMVLIEADEPYQMPDHTAVHELTKVLAARDPVAWFRGVPDPDVLTSVDAASLRNAKRILMGLSLWLRERALGQPRGHARPRTKAERRLSSAGGLPQVWEVGREVPLVQSLIDAARARGERGERAAWRLKKRFIVRGHWKRQPHGPGRSERRLQFIAPYWKGPADGVGIAHLYDAGAR